ncbi:hypothetical protein CPB85DRAFT_1340120 [Mucidula mucida]|nr:hypothetical protein CPB85DRAFT_1340120 [Mucidula mucida]
MMPSPNTSLPPELQDVIIQHLSGDMHTLQRCALVSRTWSASSQHVLFCNIQVRLYTYGKTTKLLDDLISLPHLPALIRNLKIYRCFFDRDMPLPVHLSILTSVLSLLPNLIKVNFGGANFLQESIRPCLDLIPSVLGNAPLVEIESEINCIESFRHVFAILAGTHVKRVTLTGIVRDPPEPLVLTRERFHLPSLECIHFVVEGLQEEFHYSLMHNFDLPNLKQCEIVTSFAAELLHWQDVLRRGFPPLEVFKLKLASGFVNDLKRTDIPEEDTFHPLPLAGLPSRHIHLSVTAEDLNNILKFIEWWSSTFRALSDAQAEIHFTELTFAFTDLPNVDTLLKEAWDSLDSSLMHPMFSGVRRVHLERSRWCGVLIEYPGFAARMREVLPRLASRGLLRFVEDEDTGAPS